MAAPTTAPALTGLQKSAILLVALGDQVSAELVETPERRRSADGDQRDRESSVGFAGTGRGGSGGISRRPRPIHCRWAAWRGLRAPDSDQRIRRRREARNISNRLPASDNVRRNPATATRRSSTCSRASCAPNIRRPSALILSQLSRRNRRPCLRRWSQQLRADLALRIASLDQISPAVISKISTVIGQKLKSLGKSSANRRADRAPWRKSSISSIPR